MKTVSFIIVNILLLHLSFGQSRLTGRITYHNSGEKPAQGVEVSALGANPVNTTSNGLFKLRFGNKKPGDRVRLIVGSTDGNGNSIVVVNEKQLEVLRLPSNPEDTLIEVFVTSPDQRTAAVRRFYGILEKVTLSEYERKIDEIKKELQQSNLSSKKTATLIAQTDELREERDEALAKIEEQAAFIASINKDRASELVKAAIKKIEEGENIDDALKLLDNTRLEEVYQAALSKKKEGETEINQVIEGYKLKINLLLPKFRYIEAIASCKKIIEIYETNQFSKEELANWLREVSIIYNDAGNYNDALEYSQKAIAIQEKILDPKHPDLATTYNNIAQIYYHLGQYETALKYQQKSLNIREKILDPKNPDLATVYIGIGTIYYALNQYEKALEYQQKSLDIREEVLDAKHSDLAISYNNIGAIYQAIGKYEIALNYQQKAMRIREEALGEKHPDLATSYDNIAMIYSALDKYKTAINHHKKAIAIREEILDANHPSLAVSYNNISLTYQKLENYKEALKYGQKAIVIREKTLDTNHPSLAVSYWTVAIIYRETENFQKAITFQEKCLDIFKEALPENHPYQKRALNSLAKIYNVKGLFAYDNKMYLDAITAYQKAVTISPEIKTQDFYSNLGMAYVKNKHFKEAYNAFEEYEKLFPDKSETYRNWTMYYALQNKKKKALSNLQKAIQLGYDDVEWLKTDNSMDSLRGEKVFVEILKTLKK